MTIVCLLMKLQEKRAILNKQKTQQVPDEVIDDAEYDEKLKMIAEESKKNRTTKVILHKHISTYVKGHHNL